MGQGTRLQRKASSSGLRQGMEGVWTSIVWAGTHMGMKRWVGGRVAEESDGRG